MCVYSYFTLKTYFTHIIYLFIYFLTIFSFKHLFNV